MAVKHITYECGVRSAECRDQAPTAAFRVADSELHIPQATSHIPIILAVDTSSPRMSLAIARGREILAALAEESPTPHSQTLFLRLAALLETAHLDPANVDAFAVATGPGSFTGLRVGLAAIKGLAHTLGRAAIGITTLDGLALAAGCVGLVVTMIDAGRGEVYCGLREVSADGDVSRIAEDQVGPVKTVLSRLLLLPQLKNQALVLVGEGARRYREEIAALAIEAGTKLQTAPQGPSALPESSAWQLKDVPLDLSPHLALHSSRLFSAGRCPGAHAYYIRPSDAELKCR